MTEYPVLEYTYRMLSDEVRLRSDKVGLDKVVLERWDRFMEEGISRWYIGILYCKERVLAHRYNTDNIKERLVKGHVNLDT